MFGWYITVGANYFNIQVFTRTFTACANLLRNYLKIAPPVGLLFYKSDVYNKNYIQKASASRYQLRYLVGWRSIYYFISVRKKRAGTQ